MNDQEVEYFLKERMMDYCRENNMNFFQSAHCLGLSYTERQEFAARW
jgi:hypothetical protein